MTMQLSCSKGIEQSAWQNGNDGYNIISDYL